MKAKQTDMQIKPATNEIQKTKKPRNEANKICVCAAALVSDHLVWELQHTLHLTILKHSDLWSTPPQSLWYLRMGNSTPGSQASPTCWPLYFKVITRSQIDSRCEELNYTPYLNGNLYWPPLKLPHSLTHATLWCAWQYTICILTSYLEMHRYYSRTLNKCHPLIATISQSIATIQEDFQVHIKSAPAKGSSRSMW